MRRRRSPRSWGAARPAPPAGAEPHQPERPQLVLDEELDALRGQRRRYCPLTRSAISAGRAPAVEVGGDEEQQPRHVEHLARATPDQVLRLAVAGALVATDEPHVVGEAGAGRPTPRGVPPVSVAAAEVRGAERDRSGVPLDLSALANGNELVGDRDRAGSVGSPTLIAIARLTAVMFVMFTRARVSRLGRSSPPVASSSAHAEHGSVCIDPPLSAVVVSTRVGALRSARRGCPGRRGRRPNEPKGRR